MTSPQRNRQGASLAAQFPPIQNEFEALGLSIHPSASNNNESSPPMGTIPPNGVSTNSQQPGSKRGSQIRVPSGPTAALPPSQLSQEMQPNANPPSPSHTASPPSVPAGFFPQTQPREQPLQQSPPQMAQAGPPMNNYGWSQNRVPAPTMNANGSNATAAVGSRVTDSWVPPDSDIPPDSLSGRNKKPPIEDRDEVQHHSPNRSGDWNGGQARGPNGSLVASTAQRASPTSQLQSVGATNRATGPGAFAPNRNRPRGPTQTTSSSPVMMQAMAIRQQQLQQSPPNQQQSHPPSASSSQVRGTPPSALQGLIPPRDLNPQPYFSRSQSENPSASAAAAGIRPINTPPGSNSYPTTTRRDTTSPPNRGMTGGSTYHTPMESPANSYMSAGSSMSDLNSHRMPFEYDQDEDDDYTHPDPHGRVRQEDQYKRDESPPVAPRTLPNPPIQPQQRQPQASSSVGSGFRVPMRFPVQEEAEFDDEIPVQNTPPRWGGQQQQQQQQQHHQQQQQQQHSNYSRERDPSPPPAPPSPHPPIPIYSPQSVQAAAPPVLRDSRRDSTPSPPAPLRVHAGPTQSQQEDDMEPADASSDHFTPKSPNAALPADHGFQYTNTNAGRYGSRPPPRSNGTPGNGHHLYNNLQHTLFAMQMSGMPAPRGPLASLRGYNNGSPSFTSLSGAAAALSGKPESPYPPPPINTDMNGSRSGSGYGGSAESGNVSGSHYEPTTWSENPENWTYGDFVEFQRRMYANRPDAPIPPTPQSYASPQQTQHPRDPYGNDNRNGNNNNNANGNHNNFGYGAPAFGNGYGPPANFDPSMIPDRYIPSALSSYLSSPMMHNPFLPRFPPPQSLVSSPSHIPLDLPPAPIGGRRLHKKKSKSRLRGAGSGSGPGGANSKGAKGPSKLSQPPQVMQIEEGPRIGAESTVPRDSSSDETDTDETKKGASGPDRKGSGGPIGGMNVNGSGMETSDDEEEEEDIWLDEDSEDELDVEHHSKYIQNPSKRKRKWEQKWDAMVRLFQEVDRTTDSPMILLAAPSTANAPRTHVLVSRSILRNPKRYMAHAQTARKSFLEITKLRRKEKAEAAAAERALRAATFEQQLANVAFMGARFEDSGSGGRGSSSPGSSGFTPGLGALEKLQELPQLAAGGEDGLKQALSVALESLKQMHIIYESREERRREELERQRQEAAGMEYLFRAAALDMSPPPGAAGSPGSTGSRGALGGKKSP